MYASQAACAPPSAGCNLMKSSDLLRGASRPVGAQTDGVLLVQWILDVLSGPRSVLVIIALQWAN